MQWVNQFIDGRTTKRKEWDVSSKGGWICLSKNELKRIAITKLKFEKSSLSLDDILNSQRYPSEKSRIGYDSRKELIVEKEEVDMKPRTYAQVFRIPSRNEASKNNANNYNHEEEDKKEAWNPIIKRQRKEMNMEEALNQGGWY